ncbi:unnamed protein product [Allacma fusca]|uniref:ABC transporter domain-containing protein n=1 Tax=Allacma fusca TaxID=39272 RepID=A0A8J2P6C3_9HEXA|nr:unnamed protein product [Allacma fusca]
MKGLKLLLWKNFKILFREKRSLAASIIFPLVCISAFSVIRVVIKTEEVPNPTIYKAFNPQKNPFVVKYAANVIYYSPSNSMTDKIMQLVQNNSFKSRGLEYNFTAFDREEQLTNAYNERSNKPDEHENERILAGVIFSHVGMKRLPKDIKYTLKFPGSQRNTYKTLEDQENSRPNWFINYIWPVQVFGGPRSRRKEYGGFPGYFDEGYLFLQQAMNEAIMLILLNSTQASDFQKYDLRLQRFPAPAFTEDKFSFIMQMFLAYFMAAAFTYNVMELTKQIIHEKSSRLKEFMKIMGLPSWQHWLAWFIRSYILLLFIVVLMIFILKLEFKDGLAVLKHSDPLVVFLALATYVLNVISYSFFFSALFSNENAGSTTAAFTWLLFQYHSYTYIFEYFKMPLWGKILSCSLSPNTPVFLLSNFLNYYENFGEGLQWHNLWHGLTFTDDFSVGICIVMFVANSLAYTLGALYIELAFPGEFGVALPWYFPFTIWFWTGKSQDREVKVMQSNQCTDQSDAYEPEPMHLQAGVVIKNLTKAFGSKVAVNNLNLRMYENQVTSLLGPNGAGKTTTMSILTGLIRPTGGTALVNSYDITTEMTGVRASLGLCPQYNILFDNLTVEEHFKFYCQLKGLNEVETLNETERGIHILGLDDKRKTQAKHLSGGMKRKLCVGMALSAGSKVVLLDEPTAGMDPEARRSIWDLIKLEKRGRTVILSTHYMEEADLLGDRIIIIANGQVVCNGSSLYLKSKFGAAYNLVIVKKEGACSERIKSRISEIIPLVKFNLDVGAEISCALPVTEIDSFPIIFEELERQSDELGIGTYGVGSTTMEEIFVRVTSSGTGSRKSPIPATSSTQMSAPTVRLKSGISESVTQLYADDTRMNTGVKLLWQQFRALVIKKVLMSLRRKSVILLQFVIPVVGLLLLCKIFNFFPGINTHTGLINSVKQMRQDVGESHVLFTCLPDSQICQSFKSTLQGYQKIENNEETTTVSALLDLISEFHRRDEGKYMFAFEEEVSEIDNRTQLTVFFNNQAYHSPPVALNYLFNSLLTFYKLNKTITTTNYPFEYTKMDDVYAFNYISKYMVFAGSVCIAMAFLSGAFAMLALSESTTKFKYLQVIAGVKLPLYWLADFLVNMVSILAAFFGIIATTIVYDINGISSAEVRTVVFNCMLCFGWATITMCMVISILVKDPTMAYSRCLAINIFGSAVMCARGLLRSPELGIRDTVDLLDDILSFLPSYGRFVAVNGLSFGVKKGEVFGLLGINGAGKSSTFKMLVGDASITSGDAYVNSCSVKLNLRKARSYLGYCPQFDACIDELTGRETLILFARLKGVPEERIDELVRRTSENLMYQHFLDTQFGSLSGGNKRKLSTAVAMLGEPAIILLDEPTAGMDPMARRHVWNAIGRVRDDGTSVLLTSHNMEECEALCSTLAIMVKGQFKCLGSPQHLKSKLCPGYKLVLQLPFQASSSCLDRNDTDDWEILVQSFQDFLQRRFPGCILKDSRCGFLEYLLPKESATWAEIFAVMEEANRTFAIEGYNVGQVDLEQVFFNFASTNIVARRRPLINSP